MKTNKVKENKKKKVKTAKQTCITHTKNMGTIIYRKIAQKKFKKNRKHTQKKKNQPRKSTQTCTHRHSH